MNYLIVVWDTKDLFDINENISRYVGNITKKFLDISLKFLNIDYNLIETNNLNDIFKQKITYDKYIIIAYGCIITSPQKFWSGVTNDKNNISAQILNLSTNLYSLHEQILIFDNNVYESLNNFSFSNDINFKSNTFVNIDRSVDNIHDDYTPLWIKKLNDSKISIVKKKYKQIQGTFENFIDYVLSKNFTINNINQDIHWSKIYTYHTYEPQIFYDKLFYKKDVEVPISQQSFFDIFDNSKNCYSYNTDGLIKIDRQFDLLLSVASGPISWYYVTLLEKNSNVFFCDINRNCLNFFKFFINDLAEEDYLKEWSDIVDLSPQKNLKHLGDKEKSNQIWYYIKKDFIKNLTKIKNHRYHYYHKNILELDNKILQYGRVPLVWFTNVFYYYETMDKHYDSKSFIKYLQNIYLNNPNTYWLGKYPVRTRPSSNIFYKRIKIPKINVTNFLEEIKILEEQNLFSNHRTVEDVHKGWQAFTLHGISYNDTIGSNGNDDTWTNEALKYCPNIVKYFTDNKIRDSYNRVRIMKILPGGFINIHNDDIRNEPPNKKEMWGMNICITNPKNCIMKIWNHYFNYLGEVPWSEGDCYKIKIDYNHMVVNNSTLPRYHLIVHGDGGLDNDCF